MMMRKYFWLIIFVLTFSAEAWSQQDPQYSQYMFNPLSINPAYAGSRGVMNGAVLYRHQWVGFAGAPRTQVLTVNTPLRKGKVGLGAEIVADQIGPKNTTAFYLSYAYRLPLGKGKLAFGLGAGLMNYRINWGLIEYKDQTDQYAQLGAENKTVPDFKAGLFFNNKKFYIGTAVTHLNEAQYGISITDTSGTVVASGKLQPHGYFTMGRAFKMGDNYTFSPSVMVRHVFNNNNIMSADLNLNFRYAEIMWLGISFRSEKSVIFLAQYSINEKFKVGYSYDFTLGGLRSYQGGTHEFMLGYELNLFRSEVLSPRYF